jgi:hypothetical protein
VRRCKAQHDEVGRRRCAEFTGQHIGIDTVNADAYLGQSRHHHGIKAVQAVHAYAAARTDEGQVARRLVPVEGDQRIGRPAPDERRITAADLHVRHYTSASLAHAMILGCHHALAA